MTQRTRGSATPRSCAPKPRAGLREDPPRSTIGRSGLGATLASLRAPLRLPASTRRGCLGLAQVRRASPRAAGCPAKTRAFAHELEKSFPPATPTGASLPHPNFARPMYAMSATCPGSRRAPENNWQSWSNYPCTPRAPAYATSANATCPSSQLCSPHVRHELQCDMSWQQAGAHPA